MSCYLSGRVIQTFLSKGLCVGQMEMCQKQKSKSPLSGGRPNVRKKTMICYIKKNFGETDKLIYTYSILQPIWPQFWGGDLSLHGSNLPKCWSIGTRITSGQPESAGFLLFAMTKNGLQHWHLGIAKDLWTDVLNGIHHSQGFRQLLGMDFWLRFLWWAKISLRQLP